MACFMNKKLYLHCQGFTLIELMMSIAIIGILAGVTVSVINPAKQRNFAADGVRRSNMEKLVQAIESDCSAEAACPAAGDINDSSSTLRKIYLQQAPPTTETYTYNVSGNNYIIYVPLASDTSRYWKYDNSWGELRECGAAGIGTIGADCAP